MKDGTFFVNSETFKMGGNREGAVRVALAEKERFEPTLDKRPNPCHSDFPGFHRNEVF